MTVTLREITMSNFRECIQLRVGEDQKNFVASNMYSLAEAKADSVSNPYAIYAGDQMVGFIMYDFEPAENRGYISRLMKAIPECREIQPSYAPANAVAAGLYASLGFQQTGETVDDEIVVRIACANA